MIESEFYKSLNGPFNKKLVYSVYFEYMMKVMNDHKKGKAYL